jgi:hypothetical protein
LIVGDTFLLEAKNRELTKLIIWQVFPNDLLCFIFSYLLFNGVDAI